MTSTRGFMALWGIRGASKEDDISWVNFSGHDDTALEEILLLYCHYIHVPHFGGVFEKRLFNLVVLEEKI